MGKSDPIIFDEFTGSYYGKPDDKRITGIMREFFNITLIEIILILNKKNF